MNAKSKIDDTPSTIEYVKLLEVFESILQNARQETKKATRHLRYSRDGAGYSHSMWVEAVAHSFFNAFDDAERAMRRAERGSRDLL